jgi:hypothetical protein
MTRDEALADLAGAINPDEIGSNYLIDGVAVDAVRRSLNQEEAQSFAGGRFVGDGLLVEGFRLTVDAAKLVYPPIVGGRINVDGVEFEIKSVNKLGILRRITCLRYLT